MESEPTMSFDEADLSRSVRPLCFCGNEIAPALARLGSVHCHDCRHSSERARRRAMR